ncbi:MAG: VCBS repeat-containing protein [Ignavibacteria bacterium]|nr:VCBS repeat-containing protein [Ignavibacteria bacterium]MDH7527856.1 VCBS repeat-containing protein [Ignavibacteria bacterium]
MNRLSFVEDTESNRQKRSRLLFLISLSILLIPLNALPQIERNFEKFSLNGFGRYIFIDDKLKLVSILTYDFDGDGIIDIGGLDESGKNFFVYYGKGSNEFSTPVKYSLSKSYSGFLVKKLRIDGRTNLILYSRLEGQISIYSFYGRNISRSANITVDCCFFNVDAVNLDNTPELELVIYGSNFRGLGILSFRNFYNYTYKKIGEDIFKNLLAINLNADNKIDFVGYNPISRELILLRNNSLFNYSRFVYKKFDIQIDEILEGNFDDDFLSDVALISNQSKNLFILYGNGIGSYSNQNSYRLISNYSSTIVFDYNRDLIDEFVVYDKFSKKLILKSLGDNNNLKSLPLIEIENLYSMNIYRTTNTKGVVVSSSQGLFLIVQSNLNFKSQKFAVSSNPVDLWTFRASNELYPKIIFIDRENLKLNILNRNEFNSPQDLYSIPISYKYERLKILYESDNELHIVCYKPMIYNFDYFVIKLNEGKYFREIITVSGSIKEINPETSQTEKFLLNIIVQNKNELRVIVLKPFDVNKILLNEKLISLDLLDFAYDYQNRTLFTINRDGRNLTLKKIDFDQSFRHSEIEDLIKLKDENYFLASLSFCENFRNERFLYLNLSNQNQNKILITTVEKPTQNFIIERVLIEDKSSCQCKERMNYSIKDFTYFNSISKNIEVLQFSGRGKPVNLPVKSLPLYSSYAIDYSLKKKAEIVYISNYSIINIEQIDL